MQCVVPLPRHFQHVSWWTHTCAYETLRNTVDVQQVHAHTKSDQQKQKDNTHRDTARHRRQTSTYTCTRARSADNAPMAAVDSLACVCVCVRVCSLCVACVWYCVWWLYGCYSVCDVSVYFYEFIWLKCPCVMRSLCLVCVCFCVSLCAHRAM